MDHPRSRGVYILALDRSHTPPGSSPLARGLPGLCFRGARERRIIPARAGFTRWLFVAHVTQMDHPRSRGVYASSSATRAPADGSSPLARGLHVDPAMMGQQERIIPARAGFTWNSRRRRRHIQDHPRSRGVYPARVLAVAEVAGSSPLARGLLSRAACRLGPMRIIPARAGFTSLVLIGDRMRADHPRSRGVYRRCVSWWPPVCGSSPLARGLQ